MKLDEPLDASDDVEKVAISEDIAINLVAEETGIKGVELVKDILPKARNDLNEVDSNGDNVDENDHIEISDTKVDSNGEITYINDSDSNSITSQRTSKSADMIGSKDSKCSNGDIELT